jgi:hypothetical protein
MTHELFEVKVKVMVMMPIRTDNFLILYIIVYYIYLYIYDVCNTIVHCPTTNKDYYYIVFHRYETAD